MRALTRCQWSMPPGELLDKLGTAVGGSWALISRALSFACLCPCSAIMGMVTEGNLMTQMVKKRVQKSDPVSKVGPWPRAAALPLPPLVLMRSSSVLSFLLQVLYKSFKQVPADTRLGRVSRLLDKEPFVLVVSAQRCCKRSPGAEQLESDGKIPANDTLAMPALPLCPPPPQTVSDQAQVIVKHHIFSIVTRIDLLNFIMSSTSSVGSPNSVSRKDSTSSRPTTQ